MEMEKLDPPFPIVDSSGRTHCLVDYLGSGAYGQVYVCEHAEGTRQAAKRLRPSHPGFEEAGAAARALMKQDAEGSPWHELLAMLRPVMFGGAGPWLVQVEGWFIADEAWIETELCTGDVRSRFGLPAYDGRRWFKPVAVAVLKGLEQLHMNCDAHRDLHAGNVFFVGDPGAGPESLQLKLGDFSCVRNWCMAGDKYPKDRIDPIRDDLAAAARLLIQVWHALQEWPGREELGVHLATMPRRQQAVLGAALEGRFCYAVGPEADMLWNLFPEDCPAGAVLTLDLR